MALYDRGPIGRTWDENSPEAKQARDKHKQAYISSTLGGLSGAAAVPGIGAYVDRNDPFLGQRKYSPRAKAAMGAGVALGAAGAGAGTIQGLRRERERRKIQEDAGLTDRDVFSSTSNRKLRNADPDFAKRAARLQRVAKAGQEMVPFYNDKLLRGEATEGSRWRPRRSDPQNVRSGDAPRRRRGPSPSALRGASRKAGLGAAAAGGAGVAAYGAKGWVDRSAGEQGRTQANRDHRLNQRRAEREGVTKARDEWEGTPASGAVSYGAGLGVPLGIGAVQTRAHSLQDAADAHNSHQDAKQNTRMASANLGSGNEETARMHAGWARQSHRDALKSAKRGDVLRRVSRGLGGAALATPAIGVYANQRSKQAYQEQMENNRASVGKAAPGQPAQPAQPVQPDLTSANVIPKIKPADGVRPKRSTSTRRQPKPGPQMTPAAPTQQVVGKSYGNSKIPSGARRGRRVTG